jgi:hypothetical protein
MYTIRTGYLIEGLELLIRKVAYTKYDATGLVPWSNSSNNDNMVIFQYSFFSLTLLSMSQDISVAIVTGYGLNGWGSVPSRGKIFLFSHSIQTGSGAHQTFYPMSTGGSFPGGKVAGVCS